MVLQLDMPTTKKILSSEEISVYRLKLQKHKIYIEVYIDKKKKNIPRLKPIADGVTGLCPMRMNNTIL